LIWTIGDIPATFVTSKMGGMLTIENIVKQHAGPRHSINGQ